MSISLRETFLRRIERFLKRHKMPATRFGLEVLNDPGFVFDVRAGREVKTSTIDAVNAWMRDYAEARKRARPNSPECRAA